jgi:hypothetical protein
MSKIMEYNNNKENISQGNTSSSDTPNDLGKRPKKRSTKKELYQIERTEIIKEIFETK